MQQQTLAFTMNSIQWTMQAEFWLTATADNREAILDNLTTLVQELSLPEATRGRIRRLLAETLRRRTERGGLAVRLFTDRLTTVGAAQSCGFFLLEKKGSSADAAGKPTAALELYLFQ